VERGATELSRLLGRDAELAELAAAIAAARSDPAAVALTGEPGIGKTALLEELGRRAGTAGFTVLAGRAAEHERDVPFGVVVDALDDHVARMAPERLAALGPARLAELGAVLPAAADHAAGAPPAGGAAERFRFHRTLRALIGLVGRDGPVALVLDDVHWADEASVELVLHLLRRPPRGRVLVGFAMRPVDPALRVLEAARGARAWTPRTLRSTGRWLRRTCSSEQRARGHWALTNGSKSPERQISMRAAADQRAAGYRSGAEDHDQRDVEAGVRQLRARRGARNGDPGRRRRVSVLGLRHAE